MSGITGELHAAWSTSYINNTIIPMLCRKAGVPDADVRRNITSHRARSTIASQLYNAKEAMPLFELQAWRTIEVVDRDAVAHGATSAGEPWQHYYLEHCYCTFFEQCQHRWPAHAATSTPQKT
ncbi:hypothetical protein ABTZ59_34880 [Streptomyces sp. NPDC094034]|uniref:hypothetical protein n=1 Tax=Streptomyces sp. NPDC094034 TaxID=3155309 RepID=UPI00331D2FC5